MYLQELHSCVIKFCSTHFLQGILIVLLSLQHKGLSDSQFYWLLTLLHLFAYEEYDHELSHFNPRNSH
jgi:hypothetical protein